MPKTKDPLGSAGGEMGENMKKILIIFAIVLMPVFAHGACSVTTTSPGSGYTLVGTESTVELGGYGTSTCATTRIRYYVDTTTQRYKKVTECVSCKSGYSTVNTMISFGDCTWDTAVMCSACTLQNEEPQYASVTGGSNPTNCATYSTRYLYSSMANGYFIVNTCTSCPSGYHFSDQRTVSFETTCSATYVECEACGSGYIYSMGKCSKCPSGTYKSGSNDTGTCQNCPAKTDAWTSSALTTNPSVSSGDVSSDEGAGDINSCYLADGSYYDDTGTWTHGATCYYDGTAPVDKCATVSYACLSYTGSTTTAVAAKTNQSTGAACWCTANGLSVYFTTMGPSVAPTYTANCESSCPNTCESNMKSNTNMRNVLGCDS